MAVRLTESVYVVRGKVADVGVQFGAGADIGYNGISKAKADKADHVPIGNKDEIMHELHLLVSESANKWSLIRTKRDLMIGKGVEVRTRKIEAGEEVFVLDEEPETIAIEDFLESIQYKRNLRARAIDLVWGGRYYVKMTLAPNAKVERFERVDTFHCRPYRMLDGESEVTRYALNPNFGTKRWKKEENVELPAFDPMNPTAYPVCIIDVKDIYPGQVYHPIGEWWGTKDSTKVTNKIPKFHDSGLDNGYNIKYHITVPDDYFKKEAYEDGYDEERLKQETLDQIGDSLAGIENVDKVLYTFNKVFTDGKFYESGIKITPLPNPMSDDAYMKVLTSMTQISTSGHRLLPSMVGVDTGNGLGTSGKELEATANFQQGFLTYSDRELLLEDFQILKKIMGWSRNKVLVFKDIKLYTFDVTPAGSESNPTTKQKSDVNKK
ncbi:hypothetical protein [Lacihabitans soyangensis]|uniref:Phage portal protein n=1 Tax=Lacihabitans soyangensis TaxID=869394 RepID=A0AAE3KUN4_9BACT|nr:hypothetical protein [Lacihabitans soyangensis]MCP9765129.1 hypothetical protein [Lacihabitans soyangensis]